MITLKSYISGLVSDLNNIYDESEAKSIAKFFTCELLDLSNNQYLMLQNDLISSENIFQLNLKRERLLSGEPVQHITNCAYFYGLRFYVNKNVLIPRQETEVLVNTIITKYKNNDKIKILDIGTGSGCIAICLQKFIPNAIVYGLDISKKALEIAKTNAVANLVNLELFQYDILSNDKFPVKESFDIIISNPPYVLQSEKKLMHKNVVDYEPQIALYVNDSEPLKYYNKISNFSAEKLKPGALLCFEINQKFGKEVLSLNKNNGFVENEIISDLNGKDRFVFSQKLLT